MGMGGTQRATKFAKYLGRYEWEPIVITVKDVHYYAHDESLLDEIRHVRIERTESLDPLRLLQRFRSNRSGSESRTDNKNGGSSKPLLNKLNDLIGGWLFMPDNKLLWLPFAVSKAVRIIVKERVKVVFTTSPPQSVHLAGFFLTLFTRVKWIADFRDAWTDGESQSNPTRFHRFINRMMEKAVLRRAHRVVGMCEQLTSDLREKSDSADAKFTTIMNGYDKEDFLPLLKTAMESKFTITHCGSVSKVSSPVPFLKAVALLLKDHKDIRDNLIIQYIGIDIYGELERAIHELDLEDFVKPIIYMPHRKALEKIMASHLLLITIIKKSREEVISGKIFEYLGSGKPILLITNGGYVADLITRLNRGTVVSENDIIYLKNVIYEYYQKFKQHRYELFSPLTVKEFDREYLAGQLADTLNQLI